MTENAPPEVTVTPWMSDDRLRPGRRVFAVGDVHGQPRELRALLTAMANEAGDQAHLVLLGDLIDRGRNSAGAIAEAAYWARIGAFGEATLLAGNHDLFLLTAIGAPHDHETDQVLRVWWRNDPSTAEHLVGDYAGGDAAAEVARARLVGMIGEAAVRFFEGARSHIEIGNLLLVHAGIHPMSTIEDWFEGELLSPRWLYGESAHWAWIRHPFWMHPDPYECDRIVVHGHTRERLIHRMKDQEPPEPLHQLDGWRLGLDGSDETIAGAEIDDGRYRIYTVRLPGKYVV